MLRALIATLLLAAVAVPAPAGADWTCVSAVAIACAGEYDTYEGCAEPNTAQQAFTGARVVAPGASAEAGGHESCVNWCFDWFCVEGYGKGMYASATASVVWANVAWSEAYGCRTVVTVFTPAGLMTRELGCPAGPPPDAEWGHVLP